MLMNKDEQKTQAGDSRVRGYAKTLAVLGAIMLMLFFMSGMGRKLVQKETEKTETTNAAAAVVPAAAALNVQVGRKVSLVLEGNPTTGYLWQLEPALPAGSPVQVELSVVTNCEENCCGFPTPTTLTMAGVKPGTQLVRVVYARPWEKGKAPAQEKCFAVTVLPAEK